MWYVILEYHLDNLQSVSFKLTSQLWLNPNLRLAEAYGAFTNVLLFPVGTEQVLRANATLFVLNPIVLSNNTPAGSFKFLAKYSLKSPTTDSPGFSDDSNCEP